MPRYYFDLRDGGTLAVDEEGMELPNLAAVQVEAALALADLLRDAARDMAHAGSSVRMSIEVRDDKGKILQVGYTFDRLN